jgi:hypothetical protein
MPTASNALTTEVFMKHWIVGGAAAALVLAATSVAAQQPAAAHSLTEDAWALQFGIGENLLVGAFSGGVISAKHHRAPDRALRYGLSFAASHLDRDDAFDASTALLALDIHFLRYPTLARDPGGDVHMFWGLGPSLLYQWERVNPEVGDAQTRQSVGVGAGGTIGAEWFVRSRISLTAEYQSALLVRFGDDEWGLALGQRGVRFGASVYFR